MSSGLSMLAIDYEIEMRETYEELQQKDPNHELLEFAVMGDDNFLTFTEEFRKRYPPETCPLQVHIAYTQKLKCAIYHSKKENDKK